AVDGVLHIVTADRPFLVDSVLGELADQGIGVSLLLHPLFVVRRDTGGRLLEVLDRDPRQQDETGEDVVEESWMRIELADRCDLTLVEERVGAVVDAVAAAVEDWGPMRESTLALADDLEAGRAPGTPESRRAAAELLRWLVDDHFTFIGIRDHSVEVAADGTPTVTASAGTGLGMLRSDSTAEAITPLGWGPGEEEATGTCLSIGKSHAVLPVHRVTHPDLIAVRVRDDEGELVERRLAGLFASTAYTSSVLTIPLIRDKVEAVLAESGWSRASHS